MRTIDVPRLPVREFRLNLNVIYRPLCRYLRHDPTPGGLGSVYCARCWKWLGDLCGAFSCVLPNNHDEPHRASDGSQWSNTGDVYTTATTLEVTDPPGIGKSERLIHRWADGEDVFASSRLPISGLWESYDDRGMWAHLVTAHGIDQQVVTESKGSARSDLHSQDHVYALGISALSRIKPHVHASVPQTGAASS